MKGLILFCNLHVDICDLGKLIIAHIKSLKIIHSVSDPSGISSRRLLSRYLENTASYGKTNNLHRQKQRRRSASQ